MVESLNFSVLLPRPINACSLFNNLTISVTIFINDTCNIHFYALSVPNNYTEYCSNKLNFHSVDKINLSQIVINSNSEFYLLLLICKKKDVGI